MPAQRPTPGSAADAAPPADAERVARAILLRQLTAGPRTREQLRVALQRRNVPAEVADPLLERFTEVGLIDDAAYAESLIRSDAAAGGLSRRRIAHRLRERGVPDEVAAEAVAGIDPEDELRAAVDLAQRRGARMRGLDPVTARRRLAGYLARRGYPSQTVRRAVDQALEHVPEGG